MRTILAAALSWSSARSLVAPRIPLRRVASSMGGTSSRADVLDALRSVDSEALLNEVARRGSTPATPRGRPPLKAYHTYCRPRSGGDASQSAENAAHQIAFLQRHELARRDDHFRNTDLAAQGRKARGEAPHRIHVVLDNVRSAENLAKTAFGAEAAVAHRHFESTKAAVEDLKAAGVSVWALETVDGAAPYAAAPLPPGAFDGPGVALVLGNEVTGVDGAVLPLTYRTRFVFDGSAFEVTKRNLDGAPLATDNFVVGGRSRWDYGAIGGYKFLPARAAPALLYFTETATPGAEPQMHLCPVLGAAGELEREFARHGVPRL
ncbi:hypothetical protein JL721_9179 [Aureococcus anophagefferens]|nr:hypothetical protein JL721_9179 [Aureococcus anophagefferens]